MDKLYLNTAACGLLSEETLEPGFDLYRRMLSDSSQAAESFRMEGGMDRVRTTLADFLQAPAAQIAFLPNFSFGINSLVQALKGSEKVLLYKNDYPSLLDPFKINGFDITWIDAADGFHIDLNELKELAISNKIDVIAISHVQWLSGFKLDIKELGTFCRENNITYLVDATQSMGAIPIDLSTLHCDALIASNYKWMNAGFGNGVMYLSEAFMQQYPPVTGGFNSYTLKDGQFSYSPSTRNYEPGHLNIHGLLILEAAVKQKQSRGMEAIEAHNMNLTEQLLTGIRELPLQLLGPHSLTNRSSILLARDENNLHQHLSANNIIVSSRMGYIRISIHFYNTEKDIAVLMGCLKEFYA